MHGSSRISFSFLDLSTKGVLGLEQRVHRKERGKERGRGPSIPALELDPAAISGSLMEIHSRTAMSGAEASWA